MNHLGIDIGGTQTKWAVISPDYEVLARGSVDTSFSTTDEEMALLDEIVLPLLGDIAGIGVSVPGRLPAGDSDGTIIGGGALTFNHGFALGRALREAYGLPVAVENDGKACALGEYAAGALSGCDVGAVLVIGTGIGGGIVVDGKVLRGSHGFAGELSFLGICDPTVVSSEGCFGIAGGWKSLRTMVLQEKGLLDVNGRPTSDGFDPSQVDGRKVFEWINAGDEAALRGLDRYATIICSHAFDIQTMVDPEVIAIGGGISAQPALIEALRAKMDEMMDKVSFLKAPTPRIVCAAHGNDSNLLGSVYECRVAAGA